MGTLQAGIVAARAGHRAEARELLQQALQADPRSEQGWLWMSAVVETDAERRLCLERVLSINPHNQTARAGLEKLNALSGPGDSGESYLPVSRPAPLEGRVQEPTAAPGSSIGQIANSPSAHSMPTQGLEPVTSGRRPIQRLEPRPEPADGLAQLRAAQFEPSPPAPDTSSNEPDRFMAMVLIGGLSITAIAGALMLGVLLIIGWPP